MPSDGSATKPDKESLETCGTCRANCGEITSPGGVIYEDALWRVEHAIEPIPMVGWLVVKPLRHVESFADLSPEEAASFGPLVHRITHAMRDVLNPAEVYVCLFAEADNFTHIHFHLIPRWDDTPPERRGPRVFEYLREAINQDRNLGNIADAEQTAQAIRDHVMSHMKSGRYLL